VPAGARPASLDTGQQSHIGTDTKAASGSTGQDRRRERLLRNDRVKVTLSELLDEAAADLSAQSPAAAIDIAKLAGHLRECRTGAAYRDPFCGNYLVRPHSCHVRLCPDCERARATRLVDRFDELAAAMASPAFWTLTIKNVKSGDLELGIDVLLDAMAHLRRRAIFAGGQCPAEHRATAYDDLGTGEHIASGDASEACTHPRHRRDLAAADQCRCARCLEVEVVRAGQRLRRTGCPRCSHAAVVGGVYSIEVTWSPKTRTWHPHAHLLCDAPWIRWREMRDAWRAVTCDAIRRAERRQAGESGRIPRCPHHADDRGLATDGCRGASVIHVTRVAGDPGSSERLAAVRETLKYVSKGLLDERGQLLPGAAARELAELLLALRKRRLVAGWGTFRNVHDDDDEEGLDPAEFIVGPGALPSLIGLPRRCPVCHGAAETAWELPVEVPRRDCRPLGGGFLAWRPPPNVH
jgi:hypothetical protein